jgi:protein-S-isoprenylcysteine O-methyltransferase Ste14
MFDLAWHRFACSGTLLGLYGLVEWWIRRRGVGSDRPGIPVPRVVKLGSAVALGVFYLLIGPAGGAMAGGWGNLAGIAVALMAMALRYAVRHGVSGARHPATATRLLFYAALPLAVGVPWGWMALSVPAFALSAYRSQREDQILCEQLGESYRRHMARTYRWIPGVW